MRTKTRVLIGLGLLMLSAGLTLHLWTHGDYAESVSGFLIGISIVFIIFGFIGRTRKTTASNDDKSLET